MGMIMILSRRVFFLGLLVVFCAQTVIHGSSNAEIAQLAGGFGATVSGFGAGYLGNQIGNLQAEIRKLKFELNTLSFNRDNKPQAEWDQLKAHIEKKIADHEAEIAGKERWQKLMKWLFGGATAAFVGGTALKKGGASRSQISLTQTHARSSGHGTGAAQTNSGNQSGNQGGNSTDSSRLPRSESDTVGAKITWPPKISYGKKVQMTREDISEVRATALEDFHTLPRAELYDRTFDGTVNPGKKFKIKGYQIVDVRGDGNCGARALSAALYLKDKGFGGEDMHEWIRDHVAAGIKQIYYGSKVRNNIKNIIDREAKKLKENTPDGLEVKGKSNPEIVAEQMSHVARHAMDQERWFTSLSLEIFALDNNYHIIVFKDQSDHLKFDEIYGDDTVPMVKDRLLYLVNQNDVHWVTARPLAK